ncbi:MAG: sigma-70 family RNA polymerase sigma factor [Cellulosilyticaceae bacterium]
MERIMGIQQEEDVDIERIIKVYGDSLLRMCMIYLKDRALAEDAVQDTMIKVYQKYHTFNRACEEKTWIMRIAINTCKNYMRTTWFKRVKTGWELEITSEEKVEENLLEQEEQKELLHQIGALNYKYKEVIVLYYYQEMPIKEIAIILGIKEGTVKVRLQRAREKLNVQLKEVRHYEE